MATQTDRQMTNWQDYFYRAMQPLQLPQKPAYTQSSPTNDFGYTLGQALGTAIFGERYPKNDQYDPNALAESIQDSSLPQFTDQNGNTIGQDVMRKMVRNGTAQVIPTLDNSITSLFGSQNVTPYSNVTPATNTPVYTSMANLVAGTQATPEEIERIKRVYGLGR